MSAGGGGDFDGWQCVGEEEGGGGGAHPLRRMEEIQIQDSNLYSSFLVLRCGHGDVRRYMLSAVVYVKFFYFRNDILSLD